MTVNPTTRNIRTLLLLLSLLGVACLAPTAAQAAFVRPFLRQLANTCEKAGEPLSCPGSKPVALVPGGVAVDGKDDVWVADAKESLAEFMPAYEENAFVKSLVPGERPVSFEGVAVEDESKDLYVTGDTPGHDEGPVVVYSEAGAKLAEAGNFVSPASVAVDNTPNARSLEDPSACGTAPLASLGECFAYVAGTGEANGGIEKVNREGVEEAFSFSKACEKEGCGYVHAGKITGIPGHPTAIARLGAAVAVDPHGDIYAASRESRAVFEYAPSGEFKQAFELGGPEVPRQSGVIGAPLGVAFDPVSGHVVVAAVTAAGSQFGSVDEFNAVSGKFVAQITSADGVGLEVPSGVAVDSHGDLYVVDALRRVVEVFGPGKFLPTVGVGAASGRSSSSVVLNGRVAPEGFKLTECEFQIVGEGEWEAEGFAGAGTRSVGCEPAAGAIGVSGETPVSGGVSGLTAGVAYRYRLVAHSEGELGGTSESQALAFTTPEAPGVEASGAERVSSGFVDLVGRVDPRGLATSYFFQYGPDCGVWAGCAGVERRSAVG